MWCVAELNEDYIAEMEDVLEVDERPYDPQQEPVVCLDESPSPCMPRFDAPCPLNRAARPDRTMNMNAAVRPTSSARYSRKPTVISPSPRPIVPHFEFAKVAIDLALQYICSAMYLSMTSSVTLPELQPLPAAVTRSTGVHGPSTHALFHDRHLTLVADGPTRSCPRVDTSP